MWDVILPRIRVWVSGLAGIILHFRGTVWNLLHLCSYLALMFSKFFVYVRGFTLLDWGTHISSATLCTPPSFASHPINTFAHLERVWGDFGSMPSCTAPSPAHKPLQGCRLHPQQQPHSCSTQKGSYPKSLLQFISVILAVSARGRVQSVWCTNRVSELSVGNTSKSSFPSECFILEILCRISAELSVLGFKSGGKKKLFHSLT